MLAHPIEQRGGLGALLPQLLANECHHPVPVAAAGAKLGHLPVELPEQQGLQGQVALPVGEIEQGGGKAQLEGRPLLQPPFQPACQLTPQPGAYRGGQHQQPLARVVELEQGIEVAEVGQAAQGDDVRMIGLRVVADPGLSLFFLQADLVALADKGAVGEEEVQG
ncbi:hypothetical protein, partial [Aeromonas caviae]|uniref:hypothetical protein n=1 Tax=Aeromonas caviae TaxID=648 RepID=UPI0025B6DC0D